MYTVKWQGRTFEEWEAEINNASLVRIYPDVHKEMYADDIGFRFEGVAGGETKPELYAKIVVFSSSGPVTRLPFNEYQVRENAWKVQKLADLDLRFQDIQAQHDLLERLKKVSQPHRTLQSLSIDRPNVRKYFKELAESRNTAQVGLIEDHWVNVIEPLVMQERTRKRNIKRAKDNARTFVEGLDLANLSPQEREDLLVHMARMVFGLG